MEMSNNLRRGESNFPYKGITLDELLKEAESIEYDMDEIDDEDDSTTAV